MKAMSTELSTPVQEMPLPDLARQLAHDGFLLARAETVLMKTRAAPKIATAKFALVLIIVAAVVALLAAIGLIVGLVMALAALVGPLYAGLIIAGAGLVAAGLMGLFGAHQLATLLKPLMEKLS